MRPLDGVLVADFSRVLAGPLATMTLADLGATVVKVERPGTGDDTRRWGPPWTDRSSTYFAGLNRGKHSVALDLDDPADRAAAVELVRRADVLVQNFRPGVLARCGLDAESALELNPRLVYTSVSGFGASADLPGYDFVVQAAGGLMSVTGAADGEPTKAGVALVDVLTGKDALIGILAALRQRESTGRGQHVEVNLMSSLLAGLVNQASAYLATGAAPARMGNRHPSIAPYETLRCADGPLAVAVGNDAQFRRFAAALDRPALADDPRFAANADRVAHRDALVALLEDALAARRADAWEPVLHAAGIACARVNDVGAAVRYAEDLGLDPVLDLGPDHPGQIRPPVTFSATPAGTALPPPGLDEHGDRVRAWLRGPAVPFPEGEA
ncbi:Formyl-coenzyme A transferase [Actinomadura rubteroloni]|uniref:Formyl-coenzyme A transferase n=1 Tax=Actinomadura rubteroloni TaxID=1926885 RepID=A0A2P4UCD7_9ACTN|nr:CoA transferase [Actinomadura rubteroloni]POM22702.1 Formyl-coenzyme A transferase [Actinomadura rubteroloni]